MTDTNRFRTLAKEQIVRIEREVYGRKIDHTDIQLVFLSYVLGQMKATLVVARDTNGRYYEVSYSHLNQKMFVDVYKQVDSVVVEVGE